MRFQLFVLLLACLSVACSDDPPAIAGSWLHCKGEACTEPLNYGWYFPPDGSGLHRIGSLNGPDARPCVHDEPEDIYADASWMESEGGLRILDVVGVENRSFQRHGDYLPNINDGFVDFVPPIEDYPYMMKVGELDFCSAK